MTASPTDDLASAERRIQELTKELSRARGELSQARGELVGALEQQAATGGILTAISNSPTDLQGIFQKIATTAARLCDAYDAGVLQCAGDHLRLVAHRGQIPGQGIVPLSRGVVVGRAVLDRTVLQVPDVQAETQEYPEGSEIARRLGHRAILAVPLIRDQDAIGAIFVRRTQARPFTDGQIDLLKTFADQAVIAIENTRLFEEVQARNTELRVALEQQMATSDILRVLGSSPNSSKPVFDSIAQNAKRLLNGHSARIQILSNDALLTAAFTTTSESADDVLKALPPRSLTSVPVLAKAVRDLAPYIVPDIESDEVPPEVKHLARIRGWRSVLAVPMVQHGRAIGIINVTRLDPGVFADKEITLLKTFADQAVIAIENTRLFEAEQASKRELTESLEQQTATADVLKVISRSALDVQKVLDALVESAARLCNAYDAAIFQVFGDSLRLVAHHGAIPVGPVGQLTVPLARGLIGGRAVIERRTVQVADMLAESDEYPESRKRALQTGVRTVLAVPLVHSGEAIGVIFIRRDEVRPFTERQIELVNTFADQAVIAIENTRLFEEVQARTREVTEALEYQTATSDVLKVISRSAFNLQAVLDTLTESAARLCDADSWLFRRQGEVYHWAASYGFSPEQHERIKVYFKQRTFIPHRGMTSMRAALEGRVVHIVDVLTDPEYTSSDLQQIGGFRTTLGVPLLRDGETIGVLTLTRPEVRPFTNNQIELITTFADQAVIAIENARLFEELQARTNELAKTVEDLEIASQHKNQFVANMSHELRTPLAAILGYAELIQEGFYGSLLEKSLDALTRIRSNGKHLLGLINTVLDIAKIESGQFTLNMSEYAIESVVETVRAATESLAQNKKLTLTTSVDKSLPVGLGDEQRLTQVLLNLVGNAIKFTDTGEVSIAASARNGHFAVSVADTGPGIPLDQQDRIFDQFHQVDSSLTKAKGGTGLGLAIAKQIVEMHGGRIWVESTVGKGSTFQMEIPTRAEFRRRAL